MAANEINDLFATPITVLIENTFTAFKYSSFIRGYHVYKDVWIHIVGDDSLTCEQENVMKMIRMLLQLFEILWRCKSYNMGEK